MARQLRAAGCVFAEAEASVLLTATDEGAGDLASLLARRCAGEPLEQVVGWAEVAGVRVGVDPGVFVPRRRTELLIDQAAHLVVAGGIVVDLCCGSGIIGAALLRREPRITLYAIDIDPTAVQTARRNLPTATVSEGDLFGALPPRLQGGIDLAVASPPYVPTAALRTLPAEARDHEPQVALDGGPDGLTVIRRLAATAPGWLRPGGQLLVETSAPQLPAAAAALEGHGFGVRSVTADGLGAAVAIATAC